MRRKKAIILLPTTFNDGSPVPPALMSRIFRELDAAFDGYSQGGLVHGSYRMADGTVVKDNSLMVWLILPDEAREVARVRQLAAKFAAMLQQESLYLEVMDVDTDFVRPDEGEE